MKNYLDTLSDRIRGTVARHGSERRKRVCEDKKIFGRNRFREVGDSLKALKDSFQFGCEDGS